MKDVKYVCVQPATPYYTWQVEVMIRNFVKNGIAPENMHILCAIKGGKIPVDWNKLAATYEFVNFFFYEDDRVGSKYIPSVRPNILKKHFGHNPGLSNDAIFYHDCDMIFTRPMDMSPFLADDIWYLSDTRFYIGAEYIKGKKFGIYEEMCKIIGIDESVPESYEKDSGGAQYLMKNVNAEYWEKVEEDCEKLYSFFLDHLKEHPESDDYHPIQKWTADMWAVLWNAWYFGHETKVHDDFKFTWATEHKRDWDKNYIFHNAGITQDMRDTKFYKGQYIKKLPYGVENHVPDDMASHYYLKEVIDTGRSSCLI